MGLTLGLTLTILTTDPNSDPDQVTSLNLHGGTRANLTTSGPLVTFSLRQAGAELRVDNLALPINLTIPHTLANVGSRPSLASSATGSAPPFVCAAQPSQQDAAALLEQLLKTNDGSTASEVAELRAALRGVGCDEAVECNYWADSTGTWSGENCRTTGVSEAGVGCSCDHLTDFMNVVVPTSWGEFAKYAVDGESPSPLSLRLPSCPLCPVSMSREPAGLSLDPACDALCRLRGQHLHVGAGHGMPCEPKLVIGPHHHHGARSPLDATSIHHLH